MASSVVQQFRALASAILERYQFARQNGLTFDGARDEYAIFGYDRVVTDRQYREEYLRGGIAGRLVDTMPDATWRGEFDIVEDDDPKVSTAFEQAWEELDQRLQIQAKLRRVDKLAGLSTFAVLLIGAPGDLDTELPKGKPEDIQFLTPFSGGGGARGNQRERMQTTDADATVREYVTDPHDKRFGLPLTYQLRRTNVYSPELQRPVHWSRVCHIAEGLLDDDVFGLPTLERVWNLLVDLRKVTGGGAEAFFLRANQGTVLSLDKEMELSTDASTALSTEVDEYKNGISRFMKLRGAKVETLGSDVANFANPADAIITQIAGARSIPKRILTGAEMGELASSQDRENFKDQVNGRQQLYAGPYIVRQLVDRFIAYGYLPKPKKGERAYEVRWAHIQTLTEQEKSEGASKWASTNASLVAAGMKPVFTDAETRQKWYDMAPLSDKDIEATMAPAPPEAAPPAPVLDVEPKTAEDHRYASTQIQLPQGMAADLLALGMMIPDGDLAEDGREDEPHVTVKYGIHGEDPTPIRDLLSETRPIEFMLGETSFFAGDEYDVVYVRVISPDLVRLNALISRNVEVTDTHPVYTPHACVAYVRPGLGARYANITTLVGRQGTVNEVMFCARDEDRVAIPLGARFEAAEDAELLEVLSEAIRCNATSVIDQILGTRFAHNPNHDPSNGQFASHVGRSWESTAGTRKVVSQFNHKGFDEVTIQTGDNPLHEILAAHEVDRQVKIDEQHKANADKARTPSPADASSSYEFIRLFAPMARTRAEAALDKQVHSNGVFSSRRALVEDRVGRGHTVETSKGGERRLTAPDGGYLAESQISKTAMDYAEHLISTKVRAAKGNPNHDDHGRFSDGPGGHDDEHLATPSDAIEHLVAGRPATVAPEDVRGVLNRARREAEADLTLLSVDGHAIFSGGLKNSRAAMPQIPGDHQQAFLDSLEARGVTVEHIQISPLKMVPGQREINAALVGDKLHDYDRGKKDLRPILISSDNKVLDGNHRWAVMAALDVESPKAGLVMPAIRLGAPAGRALTLMRGYANAHRIRAKKLTDLGGPGSGNFGHAGRPGSVGGSGTAGWMGQRGGVTTPTTPTESHVGTAGFMGQRSGVTIPSSTSRASDEMTAAESADPVFADMLAFGLRQQEDPDVSDFEREHPIVMARAYRESLRPYEEVNNVGSDAHYQTAPGVYTPERVAVHEAIINDYVSKFGEAHESPRAIITGGLPGAGKSTGLKAVAGDTTGYTVVNSDDVKERLPEYNGGAGAAWLHTESDFVAKQIMERAMEARQNVVVDVTMKAYGVAKGPSLDDGIGGRIQALNEAGYRTTAVFTDIDVKNSAQRAMARYLENGRFVPPDYIRSARIAGPHKTKNRETFEKIKGVTQGWKHFQAQGHGVRGLPPSLVAEGGR